MLDEVPGMFPEKPQQSVQVSLGDLALHPQCLAVRGSIETRDRIEGEIQALLRWRERHVPAKPGRCDEDIS